LLQRFFRFKDKPSKTDQLSTRFASESEKINKIFAPRFLFNECEQKGHMFFTLFSFKKFHIRFLFSHFTSKQKHNNIFASSFFSFRMFWLVSAHYGVVSAK
jgi:hypothetical protein